jgi:hypothetical protein
VKKVLTKFCPYVAPCTLVGYVVTCLSVKHTAFNYTLRKNVAFFSEAFLTTNQNTRCHKPENHNMKLTMCPYMQQLEIAGIFIFSLITHHAPRCSLVFICHSNTLQLICKSLIALTNYKTKALGCAVMCNLTEMAP